MNRADSQRFSRPGEAVAARAVRPAEPGHAEPAPVLGRGRRSGARERAGASGRAARRRRRGGRCGRRRRPTRAAEPGPAAAPARGTSSSRSGSPAAWSTIARTTRFSPVETTLPYGWYTDPEILRREHERIFQPRGSTSATPGSSQQPGYFATHGRPRRRSSSRATATASCAASSTSAATAAPSSPTASSSRETLQCPYHAWTYGLDGRLRAAPRSDEEPDFPQDELGLVPVAVDTWGPFVFANAGADAGAARRGARLPAGAGRGARPRRRRRSSTTRAGRRRSTRTGRSCCENFLECYHCQVAHPGFSEVIDVSPEAYVLSTDGRLSTQHGPLRTRARRTSCRARSSTSSGRTSRSTSFPAASRTSRSGRSCR